MCDVRRGAWIVLARRRPLWRFVIKARVVGVLLLTGGALLFAAPSTLVARPYMHVCNSLRAAGGHADRYATCDASL
jgi:hypothetical protein